MCSNDNYLVTGSQDTKVKFWDQRANQCVATFREHTGTVNSVRLSPDGKWVASGSADGTLKIWDVTANKVLANFTQINNAAVSCVEYNPQSKALANGSADRTVKYWDLEAFQNINVTKPDVSTISHLFYSHNNPDHLYSASADNIKLWNIETNVLLDCLSVPPKTVADFKVSSQFILLSSIHDNTLSVYYTSLEKLNFDESIDTVPTSSNLPEPVVSRP
jgi:katanin p80 WD40 repeat-containing subunit B1